MVKDIVMLNDKQNMPLPTTAATNDAGIDSIYNLNYTWVEARGAGTATTKCVSHRHPNVYCHHDKHGTYQLSEEERIRCKGFQYWHIGILSPSYKGHTSTSSKHVVDMGYDLLPAMGLFDESEDYTMSNR